MRQLSEIKKDIEVIDGKIAVLKAQRRERMFANFCEKYGVKKGDVVHTDRYGDVMVCGIDTRWDDWVQVRKIKKDGQPYSVTNTQLQSAFEGCKVIGHIDMRAER